MRKRPGHQPYVVPLKSLLRNADYQHEDNLLADKVAKRALFNIMPGTMSNKGETSESGTPVGDYSVHVEVEVPPVRPDEIPEEWKQEREYFEEHYEEILKPSEKIDLVGVDENNGAYSDWDSTSMLGSRFGVVASSDELSSIDTSVIPRRFNYTVTSGPDPVSTFMMYGTPVLFLLVIAEVLYFLF